jgi:hypothetical protein
VGGMKWRGGGVCIKGEETISIHYNKVRSPFKLVLLNITV